MADTSITDAFKHMQVPLMILGSEGEIRHCNCATEELFGYKPESLTGRPITDILMVSSMSDIVELVDQPTVDTFAKVLTGRTKQGDQVPLAVRLTTWTDAERGEQHALILRDVSSDLASARQMQDELQRANNAIKGARIGIFEYNPIDQTVVVSDIWRDLLEIEKSDTTDVQEAWRSRVHPDELTTALTPVRLCQEDIVPRAQAEYRFRSKDDTHWQWFHTHVAVARRDETGKVVSVIGAMADITARKTAEIELRRSVQQFRSSFDNSTVGNAVIGLDGAILQANRALCDLLGYPEEKLLCLDFQSITHPDDLQGDLNQLELLKTGEIPSYQIEKRYIRANDTIMWGLLSVGIVRDAAGNPDHFISQIVDITEQRRLNEMKSEFVATVSHELRTPLTSILGSLDLMSSMDEETFSDDVQRLLYIAQENGKRLHALINDILDFEKFSARQMRFSLSQHRIAGLIDDAILSNMTYAEKYGIRFDIDCPDRSLMGFVDPKRFQQVMANLLSNAAKFADKGSTVVVKVDTVPDGIRISVTNKGDGIPDVFRDQMFKPFSQAAASARRQRGGTGLGLNITKQIVEQTGGEIGFHSAEDGHTTFWFTVPEQEPV
ncbi:PAS domain-containing sensor histidine kinase [Oceaniglobus ichthyenteri]|uniref:sensor histidine kinase n=1 Tax=Oceaniglobus ichthyenteri TaxID=2136177 RepID=UPI000D3B0066|nr:PAS domain-containing sensor histidine kinase [Oceaniglobus ichthyenteri]